MVGRHDARKEWLGRPLVLWLVLMSKEVKPQKHEMLYWLNGSSCSSVEIGLFVGRPESVSSRELFRHKHWVVFGDN